MKKRWKSDSIKVGLEHRKEPDSLSLPESPSFMNSSSTSVVLNLEHISQFPGGLVKTVRGVTLRFSDSLKLEWGHSFAFLISSQVMLMFLVPAPQLEDHCSSSFLLAPT